MTETESAERRRMARITLRAPSVIRAGAGEGEQVMELFSRDISAAGAFFPTNAPLPAGIRVTITVFLLISALENVLGSPGRVRITTDGTVVRTTSDGMAVAFGRNYQMEPVAS